MSAAGDNGHFPGYYNRILHSISNLNDDVASIKATVKEIESKTARFLITLHAASSEASAAPDIDSQHPSGNSENVPHDASVTSADGLIDDDPMASINLN